MADKVLWTPPERPERKEKKLNRGEMSRTEYTTQKDEIREAIRCAIGGWYMVLALPCFKQDEETLRMILFELSQAYFFKDPDPLLVLDCMLDLESEIRGLSSVRQLEIELQRIAIKTVKDAHDTSELEHHEELLQLLFQQPTPFRYIIIEAFIGFKQAAAHLGAILDNEPIWSRLLSRPWRDARGLADFPLGQTQRAGMGLLQRSSAELGKGSIHTCRACTPSSCTRRSTRSSPRRSWATGPRTCLRASASSGSSTASSARSASTCGCSAAPRTSRT